ncbi:MAG: response regulator [Anaerolineales bacterium]|nr:response regulator [Anaerolineales bacterium]
MAEKPQILIVEDDLDLSEMLNAYFSVQGYEVITAAWGEDAVRLSQEKDPDLVVLDIRLPDIDGYEVCRRIRLNRRTQHTPIIFLTEKRDRVDKLQGLELGVVDYITKPFDIQELRLRVRNALNRAEMQYPVNPITGMQEEMLIEEELQRMLYDDTRADWCVLLVTIDGLEDFREAYGFVASDDVLRAVSLMLNNTVREVGTNNDLIGHLGPQDFVIITNQERITTIRERILARLQQSMEYFYPLRDRDKARQAMSEKRLKLMLGSVASSDDPPFYDVETLKQRLYESSSIPRNNSEPN